MEQEGGVDGARKGVCMEQEMGCTWSMEASVDAARKGVCME